MLRQKHSDWNMKLQTKQHNDKHKMLRAIEGEGMQQLLWSEQGGCIFEQKLFQPNL